MSMNGSASDGVDESGGARPVDQSQATDAVRSPGPRYPKKDAMPSLEGAPEGFIDYKNVALLMHYVSEGGRIIPSRVTGAKYKAQRALRTALLRARFIGFLAYVRK